MSDRAPLPQRTDPDPDAGFTLVEVIVALAILAVLLAMLPGALRLGGRAFETTARLEREARHGAARAMIEQRLAEALPIETLEAGARRFSFRGGPSALSFVAPSASGPAGGGIYAYTLTIERRPGGDAVVLEQAAIEASGSSRTPPERRTLFERLPATTFRYFGLTRDDGTRGWQATWDGVDRLPELVEIVAGGPAVAGGAPFPALSVALRLRPPG